MKKIKVGDILVSKGGDKTKVLAVTGNLIARSAWHRYEAFSEWLTLEEIKKRDYRLERNGKYPMTKQEAEDLLGVKIINLNEKELIPKMEATQGRRRVYRSSKAGKAKDYS